MARFGLHAASSFDLGGRGISVPFYSVQDCSVFKVRISMAWHQFQLEQVKLLAGISVLPALEIFLTLTGGREKISQMMPKTAWNDQKNITQESVDTLLDLSLNYLLSIFIAEQIATAVLLFCISITTI